MSWSAAGRSMSLRSWTACMNATGTAVSHGISGCRSNTRSPPEPRSCFSMRRALSGWPRSRGFSSWTLRPAVRTSCVRTSIIPIRCPTIRCGRSFPIRRRGMGRHLRGQTGLHDAGGQRRELFQGHAGRLNHPIVSCFEGGRRGQLVDRYGGRRSELLGPEERPLRLLYAGEPQRHYVEHDQAAALRQGRKAADFSFQRRHQVVRPRGGGVFPTCACIGLAAAAERLRFLQEGDSGIWLTNPDAALMYGDAGSGIVGACT